MKTNYKLRFTFCLCQLFTGLSLFSQDVIILKNGDEVQSKVMEVLPDMIKYKKWDNLDGPIYSSNKADIFMIKYQNGSKDVFNTTPAQTTPKPADNSDKVVETARTFMINQVSTESGGACRLVEFYKQNGVEHEVFGQKMYTLEYRLIIELQRDFWKASSDKWLGKDWYWTNFSVLEDKGDIYAETFTNNFAKFNKGTKIEITGIIKFENTDNGWRISGKSMFSAGYENKTYKILSYENPAVPPADMPQQVVPLTNADSLANALKGKYAGDTKDGKKEGHGKMIYDNGDNYEGEWHNDKKNGTGKMIYANGAIYEGGWKDDKREGDGTVTGADGRKYVGAFFNDAQHGKGITYGKDGNKVFEGEYKNDLRDGFGIWTYEDDKKELKYEGDYKEGKMLGQGTCIAKDKKDGSVSTYTGEFKDNDLYNGTVVVVHSNGTKEIREVVNGKYGKLKKVKPDKEK